MYLTAEPIAPEVMSVLIRAVSTHFEWAKSTHFLNELNELVTSK